MSAAHRKDDEKPIQITRDTPLLTQSASPTVITNSATNAIGRHGGTP